VAEHAVAFISRFASGLQVVTSISRLCLLAGCTGVIWLFEGLVIWGLAQALGVGLSFAGCVLVGAVMGLSRAIPAAPGHIGSYEFFMVTATGLLGVTAEQGLALGLVTHAGVLLFAIAFGVVGALATSTSISGLRRITSPLADTDPQQQSRKLA
jgi:uncharacterized membrane protein YbhN (UPF0104 family)